MNRNMLIIVIFVILVAIVGVFLFTQQQHETQDGKLNTEITFLSESNLKNGEAIQFVLKDAKGNPLPKQGLKITFTENGENQTYSIYSDDEGKGYLVLNNEIPGSYDVCVSYNGSFRYNGCMAKTTITVEEGYADASESGLNETLATNSSAGTSLYNGNSSSNSQLHYDSKYNFYYDDNGIIRGGQNDGYSAQYIRDIYESGNMTDEDGNLQ